jgi:hypothetical protein
MYLIRKFPLIRPWQGDIYKDVTVIQDIVESIGSDGVKEWIVNEITYNNIIILSQECDLDQDYINRIQIKENIKNQKMDHDKYIPMILMAPAYLAEKIREGTHLENFGQKMQRIKSDDWKKVKRNNIKRYHHLVADINNNIPEIVIDFKHFFTISRDYFYERIMNQFYLASLTVLYREELSQRFCYYLSRIGIPNKIDETKLLTDSLCSSISS